MKHSLWFICAAVIAAVTVTTSAASSQEKKINKKDLPAPVLAAFKKACPRAVIRGTSTEVEEGKTCFEIESADGRQRRDILYLADGTVVEVEEVIAVRALPASVKDAVTKEAPKARIVKAEKTTKGSAVTYEIKTTMGKASTEIVVDPSGKVLKKED